MAMWDSRLFRDFTTLASGEIISKIAGFLAFAYLAHALGPEAYGALELAVSLSIFFVIAIEFGYSPIGAREVLNDKNVAPAYASNIISIRLLTAVICIPIMGGLGHIVSQSLETNQLIWCFAFALLANPWNHRWLMQGLDLMNWVAIGQVARMLVFVTGAILFIQTSADLWAVGLLEIIAACSMTCIYFFLQKRYLGRVPLNFDLGTLLNLGRQSASVGLSNILWAVNQYLPVLIISILSTSVDLAWFGAANRIVVSLLSFSLLYHFNLYPIITKCLRISKERFYQVTEPSGHISAWVGVGIAFGFTISAENVVIFIFGDQFSSATLPLQILIWALPITLLSGHGRWTLIAANHSKYVLSSQMAGTIVTILGCIILIPLYGAAGACMAMVFSSLTVWVMAHRYAVAVIGKLPFLHVLPLPIFSLLPAIVIAYYFEYRWYGIGVGMLAYFLIPLVLYPPLLKDIRQLAHVKNENMDAELGVSSDR